ncbi:DNA topoisomerase IB [Alphaproteobacteria bacterium GH1-50]|uniref:DNA topoisomerase n=1 Tax=Kangsaoukella pontilimi TaxID=2691042 RepID=A0A7C9ISM4_9RHOB|nr:DNA topoisomerase IB [Kangsaoukella pontilimi]MXQ08105.1 DNA topoisomerase IB [Kangsaoukella pontilimi]
MSELVFYPDDRPGFTRIRRGRGFSYRAPDGTRVGCQETRQRLEKLAVPPAYESVWISPKINGHLRASGRDDRARKQYMYHPDWTRLRDAKKFDRLAEFGAALPALRRWIGRNLKGEIGARDTAVAAALALIDRLSMRVGNPEYSRENGSYAATTLTARHLTCEDRSVQLSWPAKGGRSVEKPVTGRLLREVLDAMAKAPGRQLLIWNDNGRTRAVRASDLNARVAEIAGDGFSAKTFRTWNGSHAAFLAATRSDDAPTIASLTEAAAERLHNTPAIARSSYVHPAILDARETLPGNMLQDAPSGLRRGEAELQVFLNDAPSLAGDILLVE